jgi:Rap1a immunity proteins
MNTAAHCQTRVDQWIAQCSKDASEAEVASCRSYARAVADVVMLTQKTYPEVTRTCIPAGIIENDLVDLALPYVQGQRPTSPPLVAATLLMNAFRAAFPCPTK